MPTQDELKLAAAKRALDFVEPGMVVGLGSGSTASLFIQELGKKAQQGWKIRGIASSEKSAALGASFGIPIIGFKDTTEADVAVDGADEVAPGLALIKGGGGNLLREKIVAIASKKFIVVADSSKLVQKLGMFKLPIEVIPMAEPLVSERLKQDFGIASSIRQAKDGSGNFITDEGNLILDCAPMQIADPATLAAKLDTVVGVVEHGLFLKMADLALIAGDSEVKEYSPTSAW